MANTTTSVTITIGNTTPRRAGGGEGDVGDAHVGEAHVAEAHVAEAHVAEAHVAEAHVADAMRTVARDAKRNFA
jgi:hypothetical protein